MSGETQVVVIGNLTADPELRYTQSGLPVSSFTVASTPRTFDRQANEWKDGDSLFMRATAWREFAEHIAQLTKGTRVIAVGNLVQKSWEDREGNKRTGLELQVTALGPDLLYATAVVQRAERSRGPAVQAQSDWASSTEETPW